MTLATGQVLQNRYRIVKLLGQGGFGAVYRAWDLNMNAACAVKENLDINPAVQKQFELEAKLLFQLHHSNLPRVYDQFLVPGQGQYLVMDFVEGQNLDQVITQSGPLPQAQALTWISQVCDALSYMHAQTPPVIHRDIKPANIVITPAGGSATHGKAMLVDFGIAKLYSAQQRTSAGARAVTPGYSPLEQYGQGNTDARSDIYSLGATLYMSLTGRVPLEAIARSVHDSLLPPEQINSTINPITAAAIQRAMQVKANDRFQSVAEFVAALRAVPIQISKPRPAVQPISQPPVNSLTPAGQGTGQVNSPPKTAPGQLDKGKFRVIVLLLAALIVLAVIGIWGWDYFVNRPLQNVQRTSTEEVRVMQQTGTALVALLPTLGVSPTASRTRPPATLPPTSTLTATIPLRTPTFTLVADTPTSTLGIGSSMLWEVDGMALRYVPAGSFLMGSKQGDAGARGDEWLQHTVTLDAFWIDQTEVTNAMYALCVADGACQEPLNAVSNKRSAYYTDPQYANFPVIWVTWIDANAYCTWAGRRLPTEAEWEKAARGEDGRFYPWGNQEPTCDLLNYEGENGLCAGDTTAVGAYPAGASPYGVLDMAGNVWEWVNDWYDANYYQTGTAENPPGPSSGKYHVLRGGSWLNAWNYVRVAHRHNHLIPTYRYNDIGFRCALST